MANPITIVDIEHGGEGASKLMIWSSADYHLFIYDEETRAMSSGKIKALLLKLGLFGFLFFLIKGLLWIAVFWFGIGFF